MARKKPAWYMVTIGIKEYGMKKGSITTITTLVEKFLRDKQDFFTNKMIVEALQMHPGVAYNPVNAALHHLQNCKVVDCVKQNDGLWWYARPEQEDTRCRKTVERVPESVPRKKRKSKEKFFPGSFVKVPKM